MKGKNNNPSHIPILIDPNRNPTELECPFCGTFLPGVHKDPTNENVFFGVCGFCGARGPKWNNEYGALKLWQTRSPADFLKKVCSKKLRRKS